MKKLILLLAATTMAAPMVNAGDTPTSPIPTSTLEMPPLAPVTAPILSTPGPIPTSTKTAKHSRPTQKASASSSNVSGPKVLPPLQAGHSVPSPASSTSKPSQTPRSSASSSFNFSEKVNQKMFDWSKFDFSEKVNQKMFDWSKFDFSGNHDVNPKTSDQMQPQSTSTSPIATGGSTVPPSAHPVAQTPSAQPALPAGGVTPSSMPSTSKSSQTPMVGASSSFNFSKKVNPEMFDWSKFDFSGNHDVNPKTSDQMRPQSTSVHASTALGEKTPKKKRRSGSKPAQSAPTSPIATGDSTVPPPPPLGNVPLPPPVTQTPGSVPPPPPLGNVPLPPPVTTDPDSIPPAPPVSSAQSEPSVRPAAPNFLAEIRQGVKLNKVGDGGTTGTPTTATGMSAPQPAKKPKRGQGMGDIFTDDKGKGAKLFAKRQEQLSKQVTDDRTQAATTSATVDHIAAGDALAGIQAEVNEVKTKADETKRMIEFFLAPKNSSHQSNVLASLRTAGIIDKDKKWGNATGVLGGILGKIKGDDATTQKGQFLNYKLDDLKKRIDFDDKPTEKKSKDFNAVLERIKQTYKYDDIEKVYEALLPIHQTANSGR